MNTGQIISLVSLIVIVLFIAAMDIYLALNEHKDDTFTELLRKASRKTAIVPFVIGLLCGHIFWP